MTPSVINELRREGQNLSPFSSQMLNEAKELVQMSRSKMSEYYSDWDLQHQVFKGEREPDKEDRDQVAKGKPVKLIVPNTYAQCMTFTSFLFLMFKQNQRLFELMPNSGTLFGQTREDAETLLDRDMRQNEESRLMFQHLLDVSKFGVNVMSCEWTKRISKIYAPAEPTVVTVSGVNVPSLPGSEWQDVLKYEGNLVRNISPYRFLPDTRHSLTDFQRGDFCGFEENYSLGELHEMEAAGEVAGVDHIRPLTQDFAQLRGGTTRLDFEVNSRYYNEWGGRNRTAPVVVTKMQRWLVPAKYSIEDKAKLGPEEFRVLYHVWYANDNRLIRLEPCRWWHNEFGVTVSQFTPDMHQTLNLGLANLVYELQNLISWLYNSRVRDVRKNIFGRNIVNPRFVDTKTLDGDGDVYLRKDVSATFDRAIMPLPVGNVTQGHIPDADSLARVMQVVSGVNDNAMGQYGTGRRAAREVSVVTAGSSGRMKMHGQVIWEPGFGRLGRLMLSNQRQALSLESFIGCLGEGNIDMQTGQSDIQERFTKFKGSPKAVAMGTDYFVFDSTSPSEKGALAQNLQELLVAIMSNPMAAQQLQVDPRELLDEINLLRGSGPLKRFAPTVPMLPPQQEQASGTQ